MDESPLEPIDVNEAEPKVNVHYCATFIRALENVHYIADQIRDTNQDDDVSIYGQ